MNRKYIGGSIYFKLGMPSPIGIRSGSFCDLREFKLDRKITLYFRERHFEIVMIITQSTYLHTFFFTFYKTTISTYFKFCLNATVSW